MLPALEEHIFHIRPRNFIAVGVNAWPVKSHKVILVIKAWNDTIDKEMTSRLNEELFADIVDFYMGAIGE